MKTNIPSMFRTPGRLLRWNRRHYAREGKPMPATITHESCAQALAILHERVQLGRMNARALAKLGNAPRVNA